MTQSLNWQQEEGRHKETTVKQTTGVFECLTAFTSKTGRNCGTYKYFLGLCVQTFVDFFTIYLKLIGFSPQANYTDRATAACRRS
jgi:hypothetical protein